MEPGKKEVEGEILQTHLVLLTEILEKSLLFIASVSKGLLLFFPGEIMAK